MYLLWKTVVFHCYVSLQEGSLKVRSDITSNWLSKYYCKSYFGPPHFEGVDSNSRYVCQKWWKVNYMSYNFTSYELHFHLLPFAPYWVLFCAKTPNQKMTKIPTPEDKLQVSSLGFHRVASASLSSLVGNGYLQHDGPYWLGRSEPDR